MPQIHASTVRQFIKFAHNIQFTPEELEKHLGISQKLWRKMTAFKGTTLEVTDKEQKAIRKALRRDAKVTRIPVTYDIMVKTKELYKVFGSEKMTKYTHQEMSYIPRFIREKQQTMPLGVRKGINRMYHDYKAGVIGERSKKSSKVKTEKVRLQEHLMLMKQCRKYHQTLEVGKTYRIYEYMKDSKLNPYQLRFEGTITNEYSNYYLGEHKGRKVTFLKNLLFLPQYRIEEVGKVEVS